MGYNFQWKLENMKKDIYNIECESLYGRKFSMEWSGFYGN